MFSKQRRSKVHVDAVASGALAFKNVHMSELEETQAMEHVIDRLSERFPSLERDHIVGVVEDERRQLQAGRVRDFVPVLVEKAAKKRLKREAKGSGAVIGQREALAPPPESEPAPDHALDPMEVERASRQGHRGPMLGTVFGSDGTNDR